MRLCFSCSYEEKEEITPEDSVENLKSTIAKKKGIDTRYVHLIHKGKVLHNGKRLADYGTTVFAVLIGRCCIGLINSCRYF